MDESSLRGVYVRDVKQTAPKLARFQSLQPDVAAGRLRFSRRQQALITQLPQVPNGTHDDGVDALEIAVRSANKPVARAVQTLGGVWV